MSKRRSRREEYRRPVFERVLARAHEPRRFIQVLSGPRQVGKTTLARQVMESVGVPAHFASADDPALRDRAWLETQWQIGRQQARNGGRAGGLLVIDEIQKVPSWSEVTKRLWDEDAATRLPLRVMLLGSAPLLVQRGLTDSLAGRFELIRVGHWSFSEMRDAFGFDLDRYLVFGGYPGSASLIGDPERWRAYVLDSLVETSLSRDVLLLTRVDKPVLLRQLFRLACERSADVLPYSRMLDRLEGAGNTTTLAGYLELLGSAGLVVGLPKHDPAPRRRASSPKLLALNTALMSAVAGWAPSALADIAVRGRLVETAIGAHLANAPAQLRVGYWREGGREVDYVVSRPDARAGPILAIGVRSGRERAERPGLEAFAEGGRDVRSLVIGDDGLAVEDFLARDPRDWLA